MKVEGSVGLVTGGASGLGAGVALYLLERGARVAILDQNLEGTDALVDQFGDLVSCHQCDVTDSAQVEEAVSGAAEVHERLDLLVSFAGSSFGKRVISRDGDPHPLDYSQKHSHINLGGLLDVLRPTVAVIPNNESPEAGERG